MPICYGGGISTIEDAKKIIKLGAEKICIQSHGIENKKFVLDLVKNFGSQSIVLSVDLKKNIFGKLKLWNYLKNDFYNVDNVYDFIKEMISYGFGELLINDVDNDGTLKGSNKDLIKNISSKINIPTIFCGGINSIDDIKKSFESGAKSIAAGSFFVFYGKLKAVLITYPTEKIKSLINE